MAPDQGRYDQVPGAQPGDPSLSPAGAARKVAESHQARQHRRGALFRTRFRPSCRCQVFPEPGDPMSNGIHLETLLSASGREPAQRSALVALLNLGMIESLANGLLSATAALQVFYHAENCLFVRRHLRAKIADEIM